MILKGYGKSFGGTTIGSTKITIRLGNFEAHVSVFVVADDTQDEDILIGQDILARDDMTALIRAGKWWFYKTNSTIEQEENVSQKVPLRSEDKLTIPPKSIKMCRIQREGNIDQAIYVEAGARGLGLYFPSCIIANGGHLPVINLSTKTVKVPKDRILMPTLMRQRKPTLLQLKESHSSWRT